LSPSGAAARPPLSPYTTLFRSRCRDVEPGVDTGIENATAITRRQFPRRRTVPDRRRHLAGWTRGERARIPPHDLGRCVEAGVDRSEEHTSELQSRFDLVCRLLP